MALHRLCFLALCLALAGACREPSKSPDAGTESPDAGALENPDAGAFDALALQPTGPFASPSRDEPLCEARPSSPSLGPVRQVWGSSPEDVWAAVGSSGVLLHWDGTDWSRVQFDPAPKFISSLWGSGPDDFWVGGSSNVLLHWDGRGWTHWPLPMDSRNNVTHLHGTGRSDVWAVSDAGDLYHFDGSVWTLAKSALPGATALWSNPDAVWLSTDVAPDAGTASAYFYDRQDSSLHGVSKAPLELVSIWGSGPGEVWLAGHGLHHWKDGTLTQSLEEQHTFNGLHGTGTDDVWAVGPSGQTWHWNGTTWSAFPTGNEGTLYGVWAHAPDEAFAVGQYGVDRWNGSTWVAQQTPIGTSFFGMGASAQGRAWLVGADGRLLRYDGTSWTQVPSPVRKLLRAVWTRNENEAWAVGHSGTILHWDGHVWAVEQSHTTANLTQVWSGGGEEVWAVGVGGTVLRRSGGVWSPFPSGTEADVNDIWGTGASNLWVVTTNPRTSEVRHWDGETWKTEVHDARGLRWLGGSGPNDVWAAGYSLDALLHWDGMAWKRVTSPWSETRPHEVFSAMGPLRVRGPDDVWLGARKYIGGDFTNASYWLLHWDGHEWNRVQSGDADVMTAQGEALWVLDSDGRVLRRCP
ncbi:hypothetical protein ACLESO_06055 [Pyxidicoccus sp. 3LG]